MIIPSIDLMGGDAVQLIGGKELAINAGNPLPIAEKFRLAGEIAVIDLDAALSQGSNAAVIEQLLRVADCRVGGGIRDVETAIRWLDAGAKKIILGTKAVPEILKELPKERVIAALDAVDGEVVVEGWQTKTGANIIDRIRELNDYVGGYLITFVEREGRLGGTNLDKVEELVAAADGREVTIAGGVTTAEDIATLDKMGADAQVGMALYAKQLHLADAIAAPLISDREDGLWPTIVSDESGVALGLAWSNLESLRVAVDKLAGAYHSRKRGLWVKGESSGATQSLKRIALDCDRDAIRFTVSQSGNGFCHKDTYSCWGEIEGIDSLFRTIESRIENAPEGSYTKRLIEDETLLKAKIKEEAGELLEAETSPEIVWESADLLYFVFTHLASKGIKLSEVKKELEMRGRKVTRRPGNAK